MPGFKLKENHVKESKPYKLFLHGLLYIILNYPSNQSHSKLILCLLSNYSSNILLKLCSLYSLIDPDTIRNWTNKTFDIVYTYLKKICEYLQNSIKSHNHISCTADGYILKRIFYWPDKTNNHLSYKSIPFDDNDLREYLKNKFDWPWIDEFRIEPNYEQNSIDIYKPNTPDEMIRLSINKEKDKAVLMIDGEITDEFVIVKNDSVLSIMTNSGKTLESQFLYKLKHKCRDCQNGLLRHISMTSNIRRRVINNDNSSVK